MGIAPRRAGDAAGGVLDGGAGVGVTPAPDHVDYVVHAVWATISAIVSIPLEVRRALVTEGHVTDRRCRPADAGPGTSVAECRRSCRPSRPRCAEAQRVATGFRLEDDVSSAGHALRRRYSKRRGCSPRALPYEQNRTERSVRQPQPDRATRSLACSSVSRACSRRLSTLPSGNRRSELRVDFRGRIENCGDIRLEHDGDNWLRHSRGKTIRLRLRVVEVVFRADFVSLRSLNRACLLHTSSARSASLAWR